MAISSSSSSSSSDNEVQKCSKQCLESFKTLQKNYDSEREKHSRARLEIQGYELALESLESRILVHEKNELAWGEKYEFQNYELKCREIKINNLNLELEKVVKERDELKLKIEKWEESSKNLDELLNSQMSARDKTGLGYGTQLNEMSNNSETDSEISLSVFDVRSSDEENTPANDSFSKVDGFHAVPPPITGNFLTPRADISFAGLDEYAIRKKIIESKTTDLNTKTSETVGKTNEANTQKPKTVYESVNRDKVIIEDWNSDDEDDVSEVQTVSPVKTNETQTVKTRVDKIGQTSQKQGIGFKKIKACFVCKSTDHLIKDCNFHDKQSQEPKLKTVVKWSGWTNRVLTRTCLITPVKQNEKRAVHKVSTARTVSTARPVSTVRPFAQNSTKIVGAIRTNFTQEIGIGNPEILLQDHAVVDSDELKFNLFSISQMCNKKNSVLFTEFECLILSPSFKLLDESQVVLRAPRKDDVYSLDLKNIIPSRGSSGKDKGPTQEYILLPLQPHRTRIPVEDVAPIAHEKPSESSPKDNNVQDLEDVADKEGQHQMTEDEQRSSSNTVLPKLSTGRSSVSTATTPYVSAASTSTGANAGESSFVYLGGKIPIDASTLPNADLPIDPNMLDLEDDSDAFSSDGIFNGANNDENVGAVADFNNMDDTINVSPIPTLRIHKNHLKYQYLGDPKSAVQTRGKIQKASSAQQALFKLQKVLILVDLPSRKKAIGIKWVFKNKRDERSFVDPAHPNKVYKVIKALYGLHQAPRAWFETLSSFLMENGFRRGTIDKTLFIKKKKSDIMLVQVYVDGIIFGSTKKSMCTEFEDCMHKRFQMSSMGKLTFFLGLQVKQQPDGIFNSQDKSMIGSIMYLTTSRPYIMFAVCTCARFQVTPKASHLNAVKRIFRFDILAMQEAGLLWATFYILRQKMWQTAIIVGKIPVAHLRMNSRIGDGIDVIKIHTDHNVADLLTKGFDVTRFNFLVVSIELLNLESLERDIDGIEELLLPDLFILWLTKVSTDSAKLVPMGKDSTAIKPLEKIPPRASIRSDLLFDDADGIDSMHNQAIFDVIHLMGLKNVPVPLDHFPINALTSKVFSFMVKKGKHFSGNVTPLFDSMLVQPTEDEGDTLERQSEPQPIPSPPHPKGSGGNQGGQSSSDRSLLGNEGGMTLQSMYDLCISLCTQVTGQAKEIKHLKAHIKKLKKKTKPVITHHRAWIKSGRKSAKAKPTVHKDPAFNELDDDAIDKIETEDAQDIGRTRYVVHEEKEREEKEVSTEDALGTAEPKDGTSDESTAPTTIFKDDETIAEFLVSMSQNKAKQKGVKIKDAKDSDRPRATSTRSVLTLKPLPKIDPKDKGKKVLEEEAKKVQEDWEAEEEMKKLAEEEAIKAALIQDFDDIQARIEADRLLAARLQEEERRKTFYEIKEESQIFYNETIAAQRRLLAQHRTDAIRMKEGTLISKELLQRMLDFGLEVEEESTAALQLCTNVMAMKAIELSKSKRILELAILEQTTSTVNGGINANSLMDGSLPKTTKPT
ncbi:putative ribonuclease H-like domain-containing protein [Tanacetum coccineum]